MLKRGEGTSHNDKNAVKCLTAAAEQGGVRAKTELGSMYDKGQCVPQNYETAIKWLTLAAVWASLASDRASAYSVAKSLVIRPVVVSLRL